MTAPNRRRGVVSPPPATSVPATALESVKRPIPADAEAVSPGVVRLRVTVDLVVGIISVGSASQTMAARELFEHESPGELILALFKRANADMQERAARVLAEEIGPS